MYTSAIKVITKDNKIIIALAIASEILIKESHKRNTIQFGQKIFESKDRKIIETIFLTSRKNMKAILVQKIDL